jgi:hypothetical protein
MFDAPAPKPKPKPQEPPNMLDMFDAPAPKPKPKPQEPPNMLDMFDAPTSAPKPMPDEEPEAPVLLSDIPDPLVTNFLTLSSRASTASTLGMEMRSLILTSSTRQSIVTRSLIELQLSLGHLPSMNHPLALSGSSRELLKVRLINFFHSLTP